MAKRKRASLKDKSPESLGLTQKRGKGIDLLFGGSGEDAADERPTRGAEAEPKTPGAAPPAAKPQANLSPPADADGPVITVDDGRPVDELGLPVAMEAPPDDLILASPGAETTNATSKTGESDAVNPATSPFALPTATNAATSFTGDANDLSGLTESLSSEEETLSTVDDNDLTGIVEDTASAAGSTTPTDDDLAGLVVEDDLSGLIAAPPPGSSTNKPAGASSPTTDSANDLSGIMTGDEYLSGMAVDTGEANDLPPAAPPPGSTFAGSAAPPPTTAAPISPGFDDNGGFDSGSPYTEDYSGGYADYTTPASSTSYMPSSDSGSAFAPTEPTIPPPSTATGAPDLSPPRPAPIHLDAMPGGVVSTLGAFGTVIGDSPEDFRPKDDWPDHQIKLREQELIERDDEITKQVLDYVGDRRDKLFEEIQTLHTEVADHLSNNKEDVNFALDTLLEANNIMLENPRQYDEALYRVAIVKTMLVRKHRLNFWSYRLGIIILIYAILCVSLAIWGIFIPIDFSGMLSGSELGPVFEAIYLSGLAGMVGGSVEIMWRLYYRVSVKQDFDPQYLMYYLVKPVLGFVLGLVMYFLVAVGTSITGAGSGQELPTVAATTGFILTMLLGFVAGYRQESVFDMIYVLFKKIAPEAGSTSTKSVIPVEEMADSYDVSSSSSSY